MGYESWLERDHLMLLDFDRAIFGIVPQPFLILTGHLPDYTAADWYPAEYAPLERNPGHSFLLRKTSPEIARFMDKVHRVVSRRFV